MACCQIIQGLLTAENVIIYNVIEINKGGLKRGATVIGPSAKPSFQFS